jgi:hypothetical protein
MTYYNVIIDGKEKKMQYKTLLNEYVKFIDRKIDKQAQKMKDDKDIKILWDKRNRLVQKLNQWYSIHENKKDKKDS